MRGVCVWKDKAELVLGRPAGPGPPPLVSAESHFETDALCEGVGADRVTISGRPDDVDSEVEDGVHRMSRARFTGRPADGMIGAGVGRPRRRSGGDPPEVPPSERGVTQAKVA